ncbi:PIH1 family [Scheffersomyces xylosifermentans]|uniref:PIH1 family n=1 Tax=Scheffersomyces xylosifermentans TaxID=1304137 RepID=UPI00315DBF09
MPFLPVAVIYGAATFSLKNYRKPYKRDHLSLVYLPFLSKDSTMDALNPISDSSVHGDQAITLDPKPGFVVKSKVIEVNDQHPESLSWISRKVFINICHDSHVPKPSVDFEPAIVFPLIIENEWEIPLIISEKKEEKDKKGFPSFVFDCCINPKCFQWCQVNSDLRSILIEWSIECIEILHGFVLEREYSIPKMVSKGPLSHTVVSKEELTESGIQKKWNKLKKNETLGLLEELNQSTESLSMEGKDADELPSLMNIAGSKPASKAQTQGKILIEEIDDVRPVKSNTTNKNLLISEIVPEKKHKIEFNVIFNPLKDSEYELLIKFQSKQLHSSSDIALTYIIESHNLKVTNRSSKLYFKESASGSDDDSVEIPLPEEIFVDYDKISTYFVANENTLYIFIGTGTSGPSESL